MATIICYGSIVALRNRTAHNSTKQKRAEETAYKYRVEQIDNVVQRRVVDLITLRQTPRRLVEQMDEDVVVAFEGVRVGGRAGRAALKVAPAHEARVAARERGGSK